MVNIIVILEKTKKPLRYGYSSLLHGYMSELLGNENYGKSLSDYTYSHFIGGKRTNDGIVFEDNPYFYIRTSKEEVWKNFLKNISRKKFIFEGYNVLGFNVMDMNLDKEYFETDSSTPILVSKKYNLFDVLSQKELYDTEDYLVKSIINKGKDFGIDIDKNLSIKIVSQKKHTDVFYRDIINKGRNFKLKITCDKPTKEFILTYGIGRSTSCGFGFLI